MKKKSTFGMVLTVVIVALVGIALTILAAFIAGNIDVQLFDLKNLNIANFVSVIIVGCVLTAITVGFLILFASKSIFMKIRDYFLEDKINGGKRK